MPRSTIGEMYRFLEYLGTTHNIFTIISYALNQVHLGLLPKDLTSLQKKPFSLAEIILSNLS